MATWQVKGLDEYIRKLEKLSSESEETLKRSIYPAAGIVAQAISAATHSVPVDDRYVKKGEMQQGIRTEEKEILAAGVGIAKHRNENGFVNTHVGFTPEAARIARKIESGRSYLRKSPFVRRAVNGSKAAAEAAIKNELDVEIQKLMN